MSEQDRARWDAAYTERGVAPIPALPAVFGDHLDLFPCTGTALEIACGTGAATVWLAQRGLAAHGVDVSEVAIAEARTLAAKYGAPAHFDIVDLDAGLPAGAPVNLLLCHRFRDPRLDTQIIDRLAPGGLLAICVLSEVGATPGRFRAAPGELEDAFGRLEVIAADEGDGQAWLLARSPVARG